MLEKTIAVELPESAFRKLERAAELTYRSVGDPGEHHQRCADGTTQPAP